MTEICGHALLFEGRHAIGTRQGALDVARDIRASTARRLAQIAALPTPATQRPVVARWLVLEQRLADTYAHSYVAIYDVIDAAMTSGRYIRARRLIAQLLHAPDPLRRAASRLERQLQVPDCTGG
ncbi:MAG: hypothetical protein ACJ757_05645 [Gaiellaceae bacterium]